MFANTIKLMPIVHTIPALSDNYIWVIAIDGQAIIIDPGDALPVQQFLQQQALTPQAVLITHWHKDHTGGIAGLQQRYPQLPVFGPAHPAIAATDIVSDGSTLQLAGLNFQIMHTPGHTLEHIVYYCPQQHWLFCGDTLFAAGCGRLFEGDAAMMYQSLQTLAALPAQTQVYCTHEYTVANLRFAAAVEPGNPVIQQRLQHCLKQRGQQQTTLPSTLALELSSNPFLRVTEPDVIHTALSKGAASSGAVDVFCCLREWKNTF